MKFFTLVFSSSIYCSYALRMHSTANNQNALNIKIPQHSFNSQLTQATPASHQTQQHLRKVQAINRPGLSQDQIDQIRQAFQLFDTQGTHRIDPKQLKAAMQSLGFDSKNPTIFAIISQLDTPQIAKRGGITLDQFIQAINNKMNDKQSRQGIRRIFDLFIDDPNSQTITLSSLRRIARELGQTMTNQQLKEMLEKASSNGTQLTFQQFYGIMTKKSF